MDISRNILLQHFKVTRLVPYLEPEQECVLVPREVGFCLTDVFVFVYFVFVTCFCITEFFLFFCTLCFFTCFCITDIFVCVLCVCHLKTILLSRYAPGAARNQERKIGRVKDDFVFLPLLFYFACISS